MEKRKGIIIDTDILIKIYRGNAHHKEVLENHASKFIISCISATSIYYSLELYTDNLKHFTFIEELILFAAENK